MLQPLISYIVVNLLNLNNEVVFFLQTSLLFALDLPSSPDIEIDEHLNPSQLGGR